ncbi:MAG: heme ABC transporter permease, partial [Alphaproteobacteria bacterium]|nr:heme ABC transporter permease [Alphaproteobacteria bacterium]
MFHALANPARFQRLARWIQPLSGIAALALFAWGGWLALAASPPDYQQGETVRIMYVHVPAAWMALGVYALMGALSASYLIWRHHLADVLASSAAPIGAVFTFICLITGSLWGKPTWGTWWEWDARMTSVLILFFLYLGYIALRSARPDAPHLMAKPAALLSLVGLVNLPVIKFSVEWWNTLHQPASVFRASGPSIHPDMLKPLLIMAAGYACFFLCVWLMRARAALIHARLRRRNAFFPLAGTS